MRILNFEDDVYKANDIKKVLNDRCGVTDVTQVDNVEEGLELLIQEKEAGNICSSLNIKIREAYGCIWYSRISDWEMELLELMNQLKK